MAFKKIWLEVLHNDLNVVLVLLTFNGYIYTGKLGILYFVIVVCFLF